MKFRKATIENIEFPYRLPQAKDQRSVEEIRHVGAIVIHHRKIFRSRTGSLLLAALFIIFATTAFSQGQKSSSIVIHDSTAPGSGGENSTSSLRNEFKSALEREKPCVETMDDQDLRDAIQDERERALLEGGDSTAALKAIGDRLNANLVMSVKGISGAGGSTSYSASVIDTRTARTIAHEAGTGDSAAKQMAESLVSSLGPYLADNCKPHWVGTVNYQSIFNETKKTSDAGAMRAAARNTKRTLTETSNMTTTIKATLQAPAVDSKSVNSPTARVMQRIQFVFTKNSSTTGELYCRVPGKNPFFKGFSEDYTETTTQLGQGTDTMPVFISIDEDGSYTIKVTAPGGTLYGKTETSRSASGCDTTAPPPTKDAQSMPEGRLEGTSFDATGQINAKRREVLAGSQTSPDGRTKITWNLRLVKPKGTK